MGVKGLIWVVFLFLFCNQASSQEAIEKLEKGLKLSQNSEILEQEEEKFLDISPLNNISLTSSSYRVECNSSYCAFALRDGKVVVYDWKRKAIFLERIFSAKPIYSIAFYPFKNIICFGDGEGRATIFDLDKKKIVHTIYEIGKSISEVKFSSDGKTLGITYLEKGEIAIYDTEDYEKLETLKPHIEGIYYIAFSPDSNLIASGSRDKKVSITPKGKRWPSQILSGHKSLVLSLGFSEDNDFLASGGADCQLIVWRKKEGLIERGPYFNWVCGDGVTTVKFFKDYLVTGSKDRKIRIFDFEKKELLGILQSPEAIFSIDITPDGEYLFAASKGVLIYDFKKILEKIGGEQ